MVAPRVRPLSCGHNKTSDVVQCARSCALSAVLVAEDQTQLPDKQMLQAKLHEFYALSQTESP